jgi:hypothetical protein
MLRILRPRPRISGPRAQDATSHNQANDGQRAAKNRAQVRIGTFNHLECFIGSASAELRSNA